MNASQTNRNRILSLLKIGIAVFLALFVILLAVRLITGRSLGLRSLASNAVRSITVPLKRLADNGRVQSYNQDAYTDIIFLHHSTGQNLINEGGVREKFSQAGFSFWDHDYNWIGLRDPAGKFTGYSYSVPDDNTDPDGFASIFNQKVYSLPLNTLSSLLLHEVIIFKSCFPVSNITSQEQLEQYKQWYLGIRDVMDQHPDKVFIIVTQPPLIPEETTVEAASRARQFTNWLQSEEYSQGHPNIYTFNFFGYLAEEETATTDANMLKEEYRREGIDSHPNTSANKIIAPDFVNFVINAIDDYKIARVSISMDTH